jgi:conjugative transfer signal peptidase TraF
VIDGPCPSGLTPIFKRLAGVPGDRIDVAADGVAVNGVAVPGSELSAVDSQGRPLEHAPEGATLLAEGAFFVMGMNPSRSWDSRYFGAISAHQIVAGARPLWTF